MPTIHPEAFTAFAGQLAHQAAQAVRGTNLHGWSVGSAAAEPATIEEISAKLYERDARRADFLTSPRGRLVACIDELAATGYDAEVYKLEGLYSSSLSLLNTGGPSIDALLAVLRILNEIGTKVARDGVAAVADLLAEVAPAKAA